MFDLSTLTLTVPLYIADAVLSGLYGLDLLKTRYEKKITVILWTMIYLAVDIVIYEILGIDRDVMGVVVNLVLLFALLSLSFKWDYKRQIFVTFSFAAGRALIKYIISVLYYLISLLTGGMIEKIISSSDGMTLERANNILTASMIVQGIICVAVYVIILFVYLKTLSRKYIYKGYETSFGENIFLVFPCFAALCVSITMRILILRFSERLGVLVYEQVPETVFWIIVICVLLLGTIIATMMLFQYLIERNEDRRKQAILENQVEQLHREIEDIEEIYTDLRGLKHDMRSHLNNITQYVKGVGNGDTREIDEYIGQIEDTVNRLDFSLKSGNPITDIIIYQRQQEARKQGITFDVDFVAPNTEQIDIYDIAVILNNALDNAFEACRRLEGNREISLKSYMKGTLFFIEIGNDFDGSVTMDKETGLPVTNKKDKRLHGIGLSNIQKCARKYMGDVDIEVHLEGGRKRFVLTVMMNGKISLQK